jgi:hypothetical protein
MDASTKLHLQEQDMYLVEPKGTLNKIITE